MYISCDLNTTLHNLRGDIQSVEKGSHSRLHIGRTCRYNHINRGDGADLGSSGLTVGKDDLTNLTEIFVGEDKPMLPLTRGRRRSSSGCSGIMSRMQRRVMVFLPIRITAHST
eukprot:GABW01001321.1.p1 GENE.GABW01001321.1~~GABW01001321.1.p1  ORF type:complete len:113 (-),score=34.00 GABW01001321.1:3-341(-)